MNDSPTSELGYSGTYQASRYENWTIEQIVAALRSDALLLLKRGSVACLIARRELGGLFVAACRQLQSSESRNDFFRSVMGFDYSEARRHMKLWINWPAVENMLRTREENCLRRRVPFIVPGYRKCLTLIGMTERPAKDDEVEPEPPLPERDPLPDSVEALKMMVEKLELENRLEREANAKMQVELSLANDEIQEFMFNTRRDPTDRHWARKTPYGMITKLANLARLRPRPKDMDRSGHVEVRSGNCLHLLDNDADNSYEAVVTDPPYAISLHGYSWDNEISFDLDLWKKLYRVLKPGGFIAFFAATRLYHRAAVAAEATGFTLYPFLGWRFTEGLPKPINVSELFDRDNVTDRTVVGVRSGSGFTKANVVHGMQRRSRTTFDLFERHVSEESQNWKGYFYGVNSLKPCMEPILLAQKPIQGKRVIDNIREFGTGALNIGALHDRYGFWPATLLTHRKTSKIDHQTDHPSVKPLLLMEDICSLVCPAGGRILDPFAGTGTTAVAALKQGFDCTVIEQNPDMRSVIEERLRRGS